LTEPAFILTDRLIDDLDDLIALPGSPGQTDALAAVAARIASMMRGRGLNVDTIATDGAPIVIGRRTGRTPFTLLLYHNYDVAPAGPWRAWNHEPFQMAERESVLYGRGVAAGKGPLVAHLNAIAALLEAEGDLPCSVVVVAEGEGLVGSPHLGEVLINQRALLRADACLATAGDRDASGVPFCYSGVKGLVQLRLRADGAANPLPSGYAAVAPNPLWRLLWALGQIKNDQEEILIEGFYDTIEGPDRSENRAIRAAQPSAKARLDAWRLEQFLFGMEGVALAQAEATLPTCNIHSIGADLPAEAPAIPAAAAARIDFQLVPRQRPQAIVDLLRSHLDARGFTDVGAERLPGGYPAASTPFDHAFLRVLSNVGRDIYGEPFTLLPRGPFALPLFYFVEMFGMPIASIGCARADSAAFGANEHISIPDLVRHGQLLIELIYACAQHEAM
jgi:acetylornithine deacetylase/succinyl-diaminopimelate desuccinylase-like protein